ncbi:MAG: hypothetical protein LBV53_02410 [Mycoplasmataceae bacterium]|jgi:hypothetical protein|nr:hypothetical protein [Mycoplasmataceae bacterium]
MKRLLIVVVVLLSLTKIYSLTNEEIISRVLKSPDINLTKTEAIFLTDYLNNLAKNKEDDIEKEELYIRTKLVCGALYQSLYYNLDFLIPNEENVVFSKKMIYIFLFAHIKSQLIEDSSTPIDVLEYIDKAFELVELIGN